MICTVAGSYGDSPTHHDTHHRAHPHGKSLMPLEQTSTPRGKEDGMWLVAPASLQALSSLVIQKRLVQFYPGLLPFPRCSLPFGSRAGSKSGGVLLKALLKIWQNLKALCSSSVIHSAYILMDATTEFLFKSDIQMSVMGAPLSRMLPIARSKKQPDSS